MDTEILVLSENLLIYIVQVLLVIETGDYLWSRPMNVMAKSPKYAESQNSMVYTTDSGVCTLSRLVDDHGTQHDTISSIQSKSLSTLQCYWDSANIKLSHLNA